MPSRSLGFLHLAAVASAGAALIHAAAAGSHGEHHSVQLLFAVCAVLQLGWAALVLVTSRAPAIAAGIVLNAGAVGAWALQRTVGLPVVDALGDPEDVGLQDSFAATLGTLAVAFAALSLVPRLGRRPIPGALGLAGAAAVALLALPALASDHGSSDGHDHGEAAELVEVEPADRCDLGYNTAEFNESAQLVAELPEAEGPHMGRHDHVDFTIDEWAAVFADERLGVSARDLAEIARTIPAFGEAVTTGAFTPVLEPDPWVPMTEAAECDELADQLRQAREAVARYPTVADAVAAGYVQNSPLSPGQGAHYTKPAWIGVDVAAVNLDQPAQLMFSGTTPEATLVGMAYLAIMPGGGVPRAFAGSNDRFHVHPTSCLGDNGVVVSDGATENECTAIGGNFHDIPGEGLFMLHVWLVPGCESDWGLFSNANPDVPWVPPTATFASGCNSGKTVADPLELDDSGGLIVR